MKLGPKELLGLAKSAAKGWKADNCLSMGAVASSFGAAGTLVVVVMWIYYSSQIFFFGAELTRAYSMAHGSKRLAQAANSEYGTAEAAIVARAEDIVRGRDPVVLKSID